ncbi:hypothetical protein ACFP9V_14850 [Deinococcus radiopugnans]|uniref:Uncharacterized protein n=1 Tax=Deinococcus radiopugnans ATCC 19172 TaxID=585398 RepID=A0A5C4Y905_9DEIO|nr:hypothetical protein [Deinococcus radiopugnans]MBB6016074.1 hypothetical protein [Deinococcus radiopugnans ATCC 19172]TNM72105.1 hypothetical protein FHR04_04515 [Deinococcus radiopugnans ATCC 19172]
MLESLVRDLRSDRAGLIRAARRAYLLGLAALTLPGLVLGAVLALTRPAPVPFAAVLALLALALVLALVVLRLARRAASTPEVPARQAALTGAIQAATAPGVALLLACATLSQGVSVLLFVVLAAGLHLVVWAQLPGWVREPDAVN